MQRTHREKYTKQPQNTWRTLRKHPRNIPSGVGPDSLCPYPNITKYMHTHNQIYIFALPNMHIHIIKYTHSFQRTHIFFPHFVGVFIYAGTINPPLRLRTVCDYVANDLRLRNVRIILILWLFHECLLLAKQKPPFCNVKTTFLHDKNHTFATQKPPF